MKTLQVVLCFAVSVLGFGQNAIPYTKLSFKKDIAYYKDEPFSGVAIKSSERIPFKNGFKNGIQIDRRWPGVHKIKFTNNYITKFCWLDSSLQDIFCIDSSSFSGEEAKEVELGLYFASNNSDSIVVYTETRQPVDLFLAIKITYKNNEKQFIRIDDYTFESLEVSQLDRCGALSDFFERKLQISYDQLISLSTRGIVCFDGKFIIKKRKFEVGNCVKLTRVSP